MANDDTAGRLKTFAMMLKFGHDLFDERDVFSVASRAVNDSRALLGFRNSMLFELKENRKTSVLAQFAQTEVHPHAEAVLKAQKLIDLLEFDADGVAFADVNSSPYGEFFENDAAYLAVKFSSPAAAADNSEYIWLFEYEKEVVQYAVNTAKLLSKSAAEALSLVRSSPNKIKKFRIRLNKYCKYSAIILVLAGMMFIPVRESVNAEFSLRPENITAVYAWFDGPIAECFKQDGDFVRKGEVIAGYDVSQLRFRLANARSALQETMADLELEQRNAFTDENKLGKVKLLQAECDTMQVAVDEAQWFLDNSELKAPCDGVLVLADGRAEQLAGKAVRTGDKIFEVFSSSKMIGEIMVNERDASILQQDFEVSLFLYTMPEKEISAEVSEIAKYPELTEQNTYCYPVKVSFSENAAEDLRYGMRGIAKLSGGRVALGYYLFKSVIVYFRKW